MDPTPKNNLPYIMPSQAQKHVTHNEALRVLDTIVQLSAAAILSSPPSESLQNGQRYLVSDQASDAFATHEHQVATWQDGDWAFFSPKAGWLCWVEALSQLFVFDETDGWKPAVTSGGAGSDQVSMLGINAPADATNKLSVSSDAVLLSHDGADHRLFINKADPGNTASLIFEQNFAAQVELGLTGNNDLNVKMGNNNAPALVVEQATNNIGIGRNPQFRLDINGGTSSEWPLRLSGDFPAITNRNGFLFRRTVSGGPIVAGTNIGGFSFGGFDGSSTTRGWNGGAEILATSNSDWSATNHGTSLWFLATPAGQQFPLPATIVSGSGVTPGIDNFFVLGSAGARWASIWTANGVIQTSDERDKQDITNIDGLFATRFVEDIDPVFFRWKNGKTIVVDQDETETTSGTRRHAGFLAQQVQSTMEKEESFFGAWGLDNLDDTKSKQWLRPDQLIPVLWSALQQTRKELKVLQVQLGVKEG